MIWLILYLLLGTLASSVLERNVPELFQMDDLTPKVTFQVLNVVTLWPLVLCILAFVTVVRVLLPSPPPYSWYVQRPHEPSMEPTVERAIPVQLQVKDPQPARLGGDNMGSP